MKKVIKWKLKPGQTYVHPDSGYIKNNTKVTIKIKFEIEVKVKGDKNVSKK